MGPFEFTQEDLASNRKGLITPCQKEWLKILATSILKSSQKSSSIVFGFFLIAYALILGFFLQNENSRKVLFANSSNFIAIAIAFVLVVTILAIGVYMNRRNAQKLLNATLLKAEGKAKLSQHYYTKSAFTAYYVFIGKNKFTFPDDMSRSFEEGENYQIFYCKFGGNNLILSFEKKPDYI
ncbi:MAG: hypothetical protein WBP45_05115 [Daejeonella sp.]